MAPSHGSCPKAWSRIQCSFYFLGLSCKEPLRLLFQILHFNRRKIWPLKAYIDWKRCATRKHIKPGVRFQYSHTAEGNMVSIRALSVRLGGCSNVWTVSSCIKAAMVYSRTVLEPRLGNSVLVLLSCREAPNRLGAKVQLQPSVKDVKPLRWDGRVCRFVTSLLLLSLCCVEFKCLTLITNPQTCWELTG